MIKREIDIHAKNRTTKCRNDFKCLEGPEHKVCQVDCVFSDDLAALKAFDCECNYHLIFGSSDFCTCPVRIELNKKYAI